MPQGNAELIVDEAHFERVVRDGVLTATFSLDIATADFKSMLVPQAESAGRSAVSILKVLARLARSGVEIRLMHSGIPSGPVLCELRKAVPRGLTIRRCPRLHAKAVIVDCTAMYLGSANLTGAGLGAKSDKRRNFEWGVWTRSPELIDAVQEQFNALWEGRHCASCRRRNNVCPVPLEEPRPTAARRA